MKKNIFKSIHILAVLLAFANISCKRVIDVAPRLNVDFTTALNTPANIDAALTAVYGGFKSTTLFGRDLLAVPDALADITQATNKSGRLVGENRNNQGSHLVLWNLSYQLINEINLIIDAANTVQATATQKNNWIAEARFLRGLLYFELVKTYAYIPTAVVAAQDRGGVVLRYIPTKTKDSASTFAPSRAPINTVYDSIYSDINNAIALLPSGSYRGAFYATRAAANSLLSRVALYRGDYPTSISAATAALSASSGLAVLSTAGEYVPGWRLQKNPESIFEIRYATLAESVGVNLSLQTTYTTLVAPGDFCGTGGFGDLVPNTFLLTALGITPGALPSCPAGGNPIPGIITRGADVRAGLYEWGSAGRGARFIETTKFIGKNFFNVDNVPVFRTPELYLNRAEASARSGNEAAALADLNIIRTNRGLTASTGLTGTALIAEILRQRMLEYAFEGHRFFDLKRTGQDIVKSPATVLFTDIRILAPIPNADIVGNPNIQQNPGY